MGVTLFQRAYRVLFMDYDDIVIQSFGAYPTNDGTGWKRRIAVALARPAENANSNGKQ